MLFESKFLPNQTNEKICMELYSRISEETDRQGRDQCACNDPEPPAQMASLTKIQAELESENKGLAEYQRERRHRH